MFKMKEKNDINELQVKSYPKKKQKPNIKSPNLTYPKQLDCIHS